MSNSRVIIVAHPVSKKLFTDTKNDKTVKCQIREVGVTRVSEGGYIGSSNRVAFPGVDKVVADQWMKNGLKDGDKFPIDGQIVRELSFNPFFEGQNPVINPNTTEALQIEGKNYYQNFRFTTDMSIKDNSWVSEVTEVPVKVA